MTETARTDSRYNSAMPENTLPEGHRDVTFRDMGRLTVNTRLGYVSHLEARNEGVQSG